MIFIPFTAQTAQTATSYLSIDEADEFIASSVGDDADQWAGLEDAVKKGMLNKATLQIDGVMIFDGEVSDKTQSLKFPRGGGTVIPQRVKMAVSVLAMKLGAGSAYSNVKAERIGKLSMSFNDDGAGVSKEVLDLLEPLRARTIRLQIT